MFISNFEKMICGRQNSETSHFLAPDICTLWNPFFFSIVNWWVWWDSIPVIRLLINLLWFNQEGDYSGWTWFSEVSHWKESRALEICSPFGLDEVDYHTVKENNGRIENNGRPVGAECLLIQSYKEMNSASYQWVWKRSPSLTWDC